MQRRTQTITQTITQIITQPIPPIPPKPSPPFLSWVLLALLMAAAAATGLPAARTVFSAYGAARKKLPVYSVATAEKKIAITFDAAWGAEDTDVLLGILAEHNARATFFLCGYWVRQFPEDVRRIYAAGHDIANHGDTHAHVASLDLARNRKEIADAHGAVKALLGLDMDLYRPPYGEYNDTVLDAASGAGYTAVQWDVDSHDWMNKGVPYQVSQVLNHKRLGPGSILLFHNGAKDTPAALPIILRALGERGYSFVPVSELIYREGFYIDHEGRQRKGDPPKALSKN
jgi:peptidoglycan/xylan/chitin deacetylase (PgdA/CDA1 family)